MNMCILLLNSAPSNCSACMFVCLQRWLRPVTGNPLIMSRGIRLSRHAQMTSFATAPDSSLRFLRIEGGRSRSSSGAAYVSLLTSEDGSMCAPPLRPAFRSAASSICLTSDSTCRRRRDTGLLEADCCQCLCHSLFQSRGSPSNMYTPPNAAVLNACVTQTQAGQAGPVNTEKFSHQPTI